MCPIANGFERNLLHCTVVWIWCPILSFSPAYESVWSVSWPLWLWHYRSVVKNASHLHKCRNMLIRCPHASCKVRWCWRWNFRKCIILHKLYQLCHLNNKYRYVLETIHNISFLPTILELCNEIILSRKSFGIGHMYIYNSFYRMTDNMASKNIDFSYWNILYIFFSSWSGQCRASINVGVSCFLRLRGLPVRLRLLVLQRLAIIGLLSSYIPSTWCLSLLTCFKSLQL
jgi:hypothetical protein